MKIKTRLAIAFVTITFVPLFLFYISATLLTSYQREAFSRSYGLSEQIDLFTANSVQVFDRLTRSAQRDIRRTLDEEPDRFEDPTWLDEVNESLKSRYSYLIVRKGDKIIYSGGNGSEEALYSQLPGFGERSQAFEGSIYLDGDTQHLIKQEDFLYGDGTEGSVFIVSGFDDYVPEARFMIWEIILSGVMILLFTGMVLIAWVYKSILKPLDQLRKATEEIKNGNLNFTMEIDGDDEIGQICQDFEEMRIRLKGNIEEKMQYDEESRELLRNLSHDLKTPVTAIKGYAEGILDGVASSPEKLDRYIRTIYNKANDMDRLVDELTFYAKIDTNRIPYAFSRINVSDYFRDCVEEVSLDLDANNIELGYFNYVDEDVTIIADAEQLKRVINNIIGNSVKYLDKEKGIINIRIKDVGDFIQVEIEDNGRGVSARDLPNIFDRFYRTDASRNSSTGGSGIGLSIVRKIIEDHGGKIWATSKEGIGTEIHFVLRKYQEVIYHEEDTDHRG